ncbi:FAD-binding oxidoreductase [Bradyrhizobium cajani]|uniref:FAD-binding protein n=1 Tax=Bradyrhizobium cajani TaxID=1928661 RepID=A0A844TDG5_9BRAD|nr:FAD-binding oxidoreductase [Bradyrhizobium cajani]MCP3371814.1 FAD-binding oxidoreductase [Bradyrhizobium cajani]MVT76366.1 FAD-binding protein [Bradyrhizobium cajani]
MIDAARLSKLKAAMGADKIHDLPGERLDAYSYDCWPVTTKWRQQGSVPYRPDAVVMAQSTADVAAVMDWADANGVPVTARGLGSSVVGGPIPIRGGISLDLSKMTAVLRIDHENLLVTAQAGLNAGQLEAHLNEHGYTLNNSPQSLHRSSIGGWVATRETGQFSSRYGGIEELCSGLVAVLPGGRLLDTGTVPRMAVGPDLRQLLIGSEGCFAIVVEVTLRIFRLSPARRFQTLTFDALDGGIAAMRDIMQSGLRPFLLRLYDVEEARHAMVDHSFARPAMFLGTDGSRAMSELEMNECLDICLRHGGARIGERGVLAWMERRFDFSTIERILNTPGGVAETIEVSHSWSGISEIYTALKRRMAPLADEVLGHFSHAYADGVSLYIILLGKAANAAAAEARLHEIWRVAMEAALESGAAISHHHGTGLVRTGYVHRSLGSSALLLDLVKRAIDPKGILNPGKLGFTRKE